MNKAPEHDQDKYFIIEVCENCRSHNWNTRHDEAKYKQYAEESKAFIHFLTNKLNTLLNGLLTIYK